MPSMQELSGYVLGTLSEAATEAVEAHVETCASCEAAVAELERQGDSLLRRLQCPPPPIADLASPEYQRAWQ